MGFFYFFIFAKNSCLLLQRHEVQRKFSREDYINVHSFTPLSFLLFPHFLISWLWPFTAAAIPTGLWHDYINQSCRCVAVVSVQNRCNPPQPRSPPVHYIQCPYWGSFYTTHATTLIEVMMGLIWCAHCRIYVFIQNAVPGNGLKKEIQSAKRG